MKGSLAQWFGPVVVFATLAGCSDPEAPLEVTFGPHPTERDGARQYALATIQTAPNLDAVVTWTVGQREERLELDPSGRATMELVHFPGESDTIEAVVDVRPMSDSGFAPVRRAVRYVFPPIPPSLTGDPRGPSLACYHSPRPCEVRWANGGWRLSGPPGTTVSIGGATHTIATSAPLVVPVPPGQLFAGIPLASMLSQELSVGIPMTITLPGSPPLQGDLPFPRRSMVNAVAAHFETVAGSGVSVSPEGTGRGILVVRQGEVGDRELRVVGTAATAGDIGYVALVTWTSTRRDCGMYGSGGVARTRIHAVTFTHAIKLFERRTGREVASRSFTGPAAQCPSSAMSDETVAVTGPEPAEEDAWMVAQAH